MKGFSKIHQKVSISGSSCAGGSRTVTSLYSSTFLSHLQVPRGSARGASGKLASRSAHRAVG
eukprot:6021796-Prymnesium_polylepis.1